MDHAPLDRMGQFFASFAAGQTRRQWRSNAWSPAAPQSFLPGRARGRRVFKTTIILDYLSDPYLRRRVRRGF